MNVTVEILKNHKEWLHNKEISKLLLKKFVKTTIDFFPQLSKVDSMELSVLLTNNKEITKLNTQFRNKPSSTNVLSFPDPEIISMNIPQGSIESAVPLNYIYLGDIAFAFETIAEEAMSLGISFTEHFSCLLVHSLLHLLGYKHDLDEETLIMQDLEVEILKIFCYHPL